MVNVVTVEDAKGEMFEMTYDNARDLVRHGGWKYVRMRRDGVTPISRVVNEEEEGKFVPRVVVPDATKPDEAKPNEAGGDVAQEDVAAQARTKKRPT